jgi:hypothetical protein
VANPPESAPRIEALRRGRLQWGHGGFHHGNGAPDCPRGLHHHHDEFCDLPTPMEVRKAGVSVPKGGWHSRAGSR